MTFVDTLNFIKSIADSGNPEYTDFFVADITKASKENLYHLPSRHIVEVGDMLMDVEGNRGVTITGWDSVNNVIFTNLGKFGPLGFRCVWQSKNVDCPHQWVTDSTGLVDDCTVCGESRA